MKHKNAIILAVVWLLVMVSIAASTITLLASDRLVESAHHISSEEYEVLQRYAKLEEVRKALTDGFYMDIEEDLLLEGAVRGMTAALKDPYTFYYTPEEMREHQRQIEGAYQGIGLLLDCNADGFIEILRVYADGPAASSGAEVGDLIVQVNGYKVSGENARMFDEALKRMQGEAGTEVVLTILRNNNEMQLTMQRGDVHVSNVTSAVLDDQIGYINIFQFGGDVTEAFDAALERLEDARVNGLIIDLRNNPGGILDDVVHIADSLLPEALIVYTQDRSGSRVDYYSDKKHCELPLVVLINENSASASEILAAAVQDLERGTIVGTKSYGKGIVQTLLTFEDDGAGLQYTSACYFTPSGRNIHGTGVIPDVTVQAVEKDTAISGIPDTEHDVQLRAAFREIIEKSNEE